MTASETENAAERLQELCAALGAKSWRTRKNAVERLAGERSDFAARQVLEVFQAEHRDLSRLNAALQILTATRADVTPFLLGFLVCEDPDLRIYAALSLGERGDPKAIPALIAALDDPSPNVCVQAAESLGKLQAAAAVDRLTEFAESRNFEVAFPALDALRLIGDGRIAYRLVNLLPDPLFQAPAVEALGYLGNQESAMSLLQLGNEPASPLGLIATAVCRIYDRYVAWYGSGVAVSELVRHSGNANWTSTARSAMRGASPAEAAALIRWAGWMPGPEADGFLADFQTDPAFPAEAADVLVKRGPAMVTRLLERFDAAEKPDPKLIELIGRTGDARCVPRFLDLLRGSDDKVTTAALEALARLGDTRLYSAAKSLLGHASPEVRQNAVVALNSLGRPETDVDMRAALTDRSPAVRESALKVAAYLGCTECQPLILAACDDPDEQIRRTAVENLPCLETDQALPHLERATQDAAPRVRAAAAAALGEMTGGDAIELLRRGMTDGDVWVRYFAARSLAKVDVTRGELSCFAPAAEQDPAAQVRIAAAEALGKYGVRGLPILIRLLSAADTELAQAAAQSLGELQISESLPPLVAALDRPDPRLQSAVLQALGATGLKEAVAVLTAEATNAHATPAREAISALGQISSAESVLALVLLARNPAQRGDVVTALSEIGRDSPELLEHGLRYTSVDVRRLVLEAIVRGRNPRGHDLLETALDDSEPAVRYVALSSLAQLRPAGDISRRPTADEGTR